MKKSKTGSLGQKRERLEKEYKAGKKTKEEMIAGSLYNPKDSADFVQGYRGKGEDIYPGMKGTPAQMGKLQKIVDTGKKPPVKYSIMGRKFIPTKKK